MLHRNLGWKLAALLLALCLWAYATVSEQVGEKRFPVPIEMGPLPRGLALVSSPGKALVLLRGEREALETAADRVQAEAVLLSSHPGRVRAKVEATHPTELTLVRVIPEEITLRLERIVNKVFPVICEFQGELSPGYVLGKPLTNPARARASGAQSAVARINRIVARIDTSYSTLGQPQSGLLAAVNAAGQEVPGIRVEPQTATVIVPVQRTIASRLAPVFVALLGMPREGFVVKDITVDPPLVTAAGEADKVNALRSVATLPLSLNHASASFTRRLALVAPEGIASLSEKAVLVRVTIAPLPPAPKRPTPPAEPPAVPGQME